MASGWSRTLPRARVRLGAPKRVTFVYPYYQNAAFFARQVETWRGYPAELRTFLSAIVVDDGSPTPAVFPEPMPLEARLFRIAVDVRWNWLAARNIGFHYAAPGWVLVTDMDHVVPEATFRSVIYGAHEPDVIYAFSRVEHTDAPANPHSASFLLTKALFWTVGGYDEALSGHYGTDGDWRRRCAAVAPMHVLSDVLVRHEFVQDASTTRYLRKQPEDAGARRIIAARGKRWTPKTLSFPYHEVTLEAACRDSLAQS